VGGTSGGDHNMTDKWLRLEDAIKLIEGQLGVPTSPARIALIEACGSSKVQSIERNPEHGGQGDIHWWEQAIPPSEWRDPDPHVDLFTGEVRLQGNTYGSRSIKKDCGHDAEGRLVVRIWSSEVLFSEPDLLFWLARHPQIAKRKKTGRPPKTLDEARTALTKLESEGIDLKEKHESIFDHAKSPSGNFIKDCTAFTT
jgi:hypothetical protein